METFEQTRKHQFLATDKQKANILNLQSTPKIKI